MLVRLSLLQRVILSFHKKNGRGGTRTTSPTTAKIMNGWDINHEVLAFLIEVSTVEIL